LSRSALFNGATFLTPTSRGNSLSPRNFDIVILINQALQGIADFIGKERNAQKTGECLVAEKF